MRQDPRMREVELPEESPGAVATRRVFLGLAAGAVVAAGAARVLGTAAGGAAAAPHAAAAVELDSVPRDEAERLMAGLVPPDRLENAIAALQDRTLHLVRCPFYGIGDGIGRQVRIGSGAVARVITLSAVPITVLLPIRVMGQILVEALGPSTLLGLVTITGPTPLPPVAAGGALAIDVIVQ